MKKLIYLFAILFCSLNLSAEDIYVQTFDTWLPEGWSVIEGPGTSYYSHWFHKDDVRATVFVTNDNQDEWLISPDIELPATGDLELAVQMMGSFYRMVTMDYGDLIVYISTDSGTNWELLWQADNQALVTASGVDWPWQTNTWFYPSMSLNDFAGETIKIAFRYISPDGDADWWNLDNFIVKSLLQNEIELQDFEFPEYGVAGDVVTFEGTLKNYGVNDVTSFEVVYTVDGVESDPCIVDNVNVQYNTTYSFSHDIPFTFVNPEIHDLSLEVTKVNGQIDPITENNILYGDISIAMEVVNRKPMFEIFTSSTCGACPWTNEDMDAIFANNPGNYSLVKYQVYWPGLGDPYYIIEDSIRAVYYGVTGVPRVHVNGYQDDGIGYTQADFNNALNTDAYAEIDLAYAFNGTGVEVYLNITPKIHIADAAVHMAVVEKTTYENTGTNGETEFHNVLMKMLPDAYGSTYSLEPDVQISLTEIADLSDTFIEEFTDLQVVVWVQDNETKFVLQSESSDLMVGIDEIPKDNVQVFPNPASKNITVKAEAQLEKFELYNNLGQLIIEKDIDFDQQSLDVSHLDPGVYFLKIQSENKIISRKLVIE